MKKNTEVIMAMVNYYSGDTKRINHFMKVLGYASLICDSENMDTETRLIIEMAAIVHDIGIKISEEKYNSSSGHYQQIEGPAEARRMLGKLKVKENIIERCCWLIANHHTYTNIEDIDHQILVEADFLVNIDEDEISKEATHKVKEEIFKTKAGIELLAHLFNE